MLISIVMPCYNAEKFLDRSVQSIIDQTFTDWELVIVNDGSTDNSGAKARSWAKEDRRIHVKDKINGGYVSARLYGYNFISEESKYVLFYDADDKLHSEMLQILSAEMENDQRVGAAYCNHSVIDESDNVTPSGFDMPRFVPTAFWVKKLPETTLETPFISIFCWTKMIEPMTLIRRKAYEETPGWDMNFGLGVGNIGEGVYLFSEIALRWKVHYLNRKLYFYRRYSGQMSGVSSVKMKEQAYKIIQMWNNRLINEFEFTPKISLAIQFYVHRLCCYSTCNSLKHQLRYYPIKAIRSVFIIGYQFIASLPLVFTYKRLLH